MRRSGGVASLSDANRAADPRATAAAPVRRKSRREMIATAEGVVGVVMSECAATQEMLLHDSVSRSLVSSVASLANCYLRSAFRRAVQADHSSFVITGAGIASRT